MAAVLCQGIGKACNSVCGCLEAICKAPFRLCGACCDGFGQCCSESCQLVTNCCSSEFCCYITVATVLNLPPILVGFTDLPNIGSGCQGSVWLLIFWLLCLINIVAAFYMSVAVQRDDSILPPQDGNVQHHSVTQNATEGVHRIKQLFCYDVWMAVYILVLCGFFGWLLLGGVWFATGNMDDDEDCDGIHGKVMIAYGFGWAFVCVGGCALMTSLCCAFLNPSSNRRPQQQQQQQSSGQGAPPAAGSNTNSASAPAASSSGNQNNNKPQPSAPTETDHIPVAQATVIPETGYGSADDKNQYSKV